MTFRLASVYNPHMIAAVRHRVTIQPGGRIELTSLELTPGTEAEVIVLVEREADGAPAARLAALSALQRAVGLTGEQAAAWSSDVRAEREAWNGPA